ncbi:MAG TPA: hypothetical protein VIO14_07660 [Dehalococcoidia bacterium]
MRLLLRVAHAMAQEDDHQGILRLLNRSVVDTLGCDRSNTMLLDEDGSVSLAQSYGAEPPPPIPTPQRTTSAPSGPLSSGCSGSSGRWW